MRNLPLWSPRFQVIEDGGDTVLQYKPFPRYPSWLEAWRFVAGGGGSAQYAKHAYVAPFGWQWTVGTPAAPEFGYDPFGLVTMYSNDNPNTRRFSFTLQFHEIGYYAFNFSSKWTPDGGIAKVYVNSELVAEFDTYAAFESGGATHSSQFLASVVGVGGGEIVVEIHCDSKNDLSTGYQVHVGQFMIYPYDF